MPRHENTAPRSDGLRRCPAVAASGAPCTRLGRSSGWCWQHVPVEVPAPTLDAEGAALVRTTTGVVFRVDVADYAGVARYRWTLSRSGYPRRWVLLEGRKPRSIEIQRHILGLTFGDGLIGDHINGDVLDNRRVNLRAVTAAENAQNCRALIGYRGVRYDRRDKRWIAAADVNRTRHYIGRFDTEAEAAAAVHSWRLQNMPGYIDRPEARRSA